LARNLTKR